MLFITQIIWHDKHFKCLLQIQKKLNLYMSYIDDNSYFKKRKNKLNLYVSDAVPAQAPPPHPNYVFASWLPPRCFQKTFRIQQS